MTSSILRTAARLLMPLLLLFAVFLLLRGHNQPGGGFVAGLVVAASFVLYSIAFGVDAARRALLVRPSALLGIGLLVALLSGLPAVVLVPAPDYGEAWDWAYDVEAAVLQAGGIDVEARPWTDVGDVRGSDLVLPLVAWGYHDNPAQWHALLNQLESSGATIVNPVPVLRWNALRGRL